MILFGSFRLGETCFASSLLELWSFDEAVIRSLTKEAILEKINQPALIRYSACIHVAAHAVMSPFSLQLGSESDQDRVLVL